MKLWNKQVGWNHFRIWRASVQHAIRCFTPLAEKERRGGRCVFYPVLQWAVRGRTELVKRGLIVGNESRGWNESGPIQICVLWLQSVSLGVSQCRLSAGAQVKAALWIPLGGWGGPLQSAGWGPSSEWLPKGLVSDWPLVGVQEEEAGKDLKKKKKFIQENQHWITWQTMCPKHENIKFDLVVYLSDNNMFPLTKQEMKSPPNDWLTDLSTCWAISIKIQ